MGTLDEIQRLPDGKFHLLCDELLRRTEPRYRRLRTHGLNDRGESIKGQPDSYVGDTASTCTIAVCYTVQRSGWWNKVIQDVRDAVAASPNVKEIVVVIPHNVDRDGPKDKNIDWHSDARKEAGTASLWVIDGREISALLDTDHQDLRHDHLGIPYSRLSRESIFAGCRMASLAAIESITMSGRYDPGRYAPRTADKELYRLWQAGFRPETASNHGSAPPRLISLVSDSGMGKTSLVCEFTRTLGTVLPVLLVQARDLSFGTEDSLVASVIQAIQGFLDPVVRAIEEAAISKHLPVSAPLTVVVDGLDEAHQPEAVRKAITFWLRSKLGKTSILIATSRREFWTTCVDPSWAQWMPEPNSDDRLPLKVADRSQMERRNTAAGIRLPDLFNDEELESAWIRAGRSRQEFFSLPPDAREELRSPFTLRVFFDLFAQAGHRPQTVTSAALLETWLNHRLDVEAMPRDRINRSHFQQALQSVAERIANANAGSVSVDELADVPRFDPVHPPGQVVQRLINANILESLPGQSDHVRFSVEAVQDFYRAEADIEAIRNNPADVAERFSRLSFTTAYPRLVRFGYGLVAHEARDEFVGRLAELDARMAAVALRAAPGSFSQTLRTQIVTNLSTQISGRHRVRAALALTLLGDLMCQESIDALAAHLLSPAALHPPLNSLGASAFTKLAYAPAAAFVYRWEWFGLRLGNESYYFRELLASIRAASPDFRTALAAQSIHHLSSASGTKEHAKAVTVLGYLGDQRLVEHLGSRLKENGVLTHYENHALIALGEAAAADLFAQSVRDVGERLARLPNDAANHEARHKLIAPVHFTSYDIRYLITPAVEVPLQQLIDDADPDIAWIGSNLARCGHVPSLLYRAAVAAAGRKTRLDLDWEPQRSCIYADTWLEWWPKAADDGIRWHLLHLLPLYPTSEIDSILIDCLESPTLRPLAAKRLGEYGSIRSANRIREVLAEEITAGDHWAKADAARALGELRDEDAVPILEKVAAEHSDNWVVTQAIASMGVIGSDQAEQALKRLLRLGKGAKIDEMVFEALLLCGSVSAVGIVVNQAKDRQDGGDWLCERLRRLTWTRGWRRGEYYTHIHTAPLVQYLDAHYQPTSHEDYSGLMHAFGQIDSSEVRVMLRKWAERRGSDQDPLVREDDQRRMSDLCYWELRDRGDESAIEYCLDERKDENDDIYVAIAADDLRSFPAGSVAERLRLRLAKATTNSEIVRNLALLGRFGGTVDAELANRFLNHADDLVANVACETMLRLSDPMLVPDRWREM